MDQIARWTERENRNKARLALLNQYMGKHVAWSLDMTKVLAAADDHLSLHEEAARLGLKGGDYVTEYIDGEGGHIW